MLALFAAASISSLSALPFPPITVATQPNGAIVASQVSRDTPLVGAQVFFAAGIVQQPSDQAGVAAVAGAIVLNTPVDGASSAVDIAKRLGASLTYTVDPQDTRFSIECKASDLPRLLGALAKAADHPDGRAFAAARDTALSAAQAAIKDPVLVTYAMIRQAQYQGTGYANPDPGRTIDLVKLAPSDALAFAAQYRRGTGLVVAMSGDVTDEDVTAAKSAFGAYPAGKMPVLPTPSAVTRGREIVAHRDVASPWIAVGYAVPSQFAADFPAMLVIESLLGRGGSVHALSYGPDAAPPDGFVGGYYQYEAQPGAFVEFYSGPNIDQDLKNLQDGIGRLRGGTLPSDLLDRAKTAAVGSYLTSVTTLDDQSWLIGRAAISPGGVAFENDVAKRIGAVTASDVQRVARKYLATQTVAVVLPSGVGQ